MCVNECEEDQCLPRSIILLQCRFQPGSHQWGGHPPIMTALQCLWVPERPGAWGTGSYRQEDEEDLLPSCDSRRKGRVCSQSQRAPERD